MDIIYHWLTPDGTKHYTSDPILAEQTLHLPHHPTVFSTIVRYPPPPK